MSNRAITWATHIKLKPCQKVVLLMLADTADAYNETFQSNPRLAALCNVSERTVIRAKNDLEELGLISQKARFVDGIQRSNNFKLHVDKPLPDELKVILPKQGDKMSYRNKKKSRDDTEVTPGVTKKAVRGDKNDSLGVTKKPVRGDTSVIQNPPNPLLTHKEPLQQGQKPSSAPVTTPVWQAYADEYRKRYGVDPIRNQTVNGQLAQFVKRVGQEAAPQIARFYVSLDESFYCKGRHTVGLMLKDAEKLAPMWQGGQRHHQAHTGTLADQTANFTAEDYYGG